MELYIAPHVQPLSMCVLGLDGTWLFLLEP